MNAVLAAPVIPAGCSEGLRGVPSNHAGRRGGSSSAPLKPSQILLMPVQLQHQNSVLLFFWGGGVLFFFNVHTNPYTKLNPFGHFGKCHRIPNVKTSST